MARWPRDKDGNSVKDIKGAQTVFLDKDQRPVVLLNSEWDVNWLVKENEGVHFGSPFDEEVDQWM